MTLFAQVSDTQCYSIRERINESWTLSSIYFNHYALKNVISSFPFLERAKLTGLAYDS